MNRRGFLQAMLKFGLTSSILPSALTYERKWKKQEILIVPEYVYCGTVTSRLSCSGFVNFQELDKLIWEHCGIPVKHYETHNRINTRTNLLVAT